MKRRALPLDVMLEPTTERCSGGWSGAERLTDVMTTWGTRYLSCNAWMARDRLAMSKILTSERSLKMGGGPREAVSVSGTRARAPEGRGWMEDQGEMEIGLLSSSYSASNWLGRIRSAKGTSALYAGTTSSAT